MERRKVGRDVHLITFTGVRLITALGIEEEQRRPLKKHKTQEFDIFILG